MKRYDFNSFDEFDESGVAGEDDVLTVVHENGWWRGDMTTVCKSWKTAVRRFFKAIDQTEIEEYWRDGMYEAFENGDRLISDFIRDERATFIYGIDKFYINSWYIYLNFDEKFHLGEA